MDRLRRLVLAEAFEHGEPDVAIIRPVSETHFAHQPRLDPGRRLVELRPLRKRAGFLDERLEAGVNIGEGFLGEAAAGVADVDQVVALIDSEDHRAEIRPAALRRVEAGDYRFLPLPRLDLDPVRSA